MLIYFNIFKINVINYIKNNMLYHLMSAFFYAKTQLADLMIIVIVYKFMEIYFY